jgi:hypothetical protein
MLHGELLQFLTLQGLLYTGLLPLAVQQNTGACGVRMHSVLCAVSSNLHNKRENFLSHME